jgi:hypothetical protein
MLTSPIQNALKKSKLYMRLKNRLKNKKEDFEIE